ncbi:hypothetical protein EXW72_12345 [Pseudomonas sp. BCA14]|nr:hypothetical protein EXW70_13845 [Pseudomonas sp. JMN1]TFF12236.1 hypothetical protein EXW71_11595 [Pseudomonas sp. BCA17]TFF25887.1 hypothetical protein EXW73_15705 [Pseudomonas sp. BCA13]TFF29012.1 hypothetical protein EXW72_12345 [Pseudomonas sp. BCA14]
MTMRVSLRGCSGSTPSCRRTNTASSSSKRRRFTVARELAPAGPGWRSSAQRSQAFGAAAQPSGSKLPRHRSWS